MRRKNAQTPENISLLDEKDKIILNTLTKNSRERFTSIAKKVNLSIDSTKKRMQRLERLGVITKYTIHLNPQKYGFGFYVHVFIKFKNLSKQRFDQLIEMLVKNKKVVDVFSMLGQYDLFLVYVGKNQEDFNTFEMEIRHEFGDIVDNWIAMLSTKDYKFEEYIV